MRCINNFFPQNLPFKTSKTGEDLEEIFKEGAVIFEEVVWENEGFKGE